MIPDGQLAIGYSNSECTSSILDDKVLEYKNRARARQENINERLKLFDVMETHQHDEHFDALRACFVLVEYDIDNGNPLNIVF